MWLSDSAQPQSFNENDIKSDDLKDCGSEYFRGT